MKVALRRLAQQKADPLPGAGARKTRPDRPPAPEHERLPGNPARLADNASPGQPGPRATRLEREPWTQGICSNHDRVAAGRCFR